ncbi:ABC transporter permease, partial [Escherichia coli]|nr:ABC transporter permease [Escherichia coli]
MMNTTPQPTTAAAVAAPRKQSPWRRVVSDFLASKTAVFGLAGVVILMLAALAAPWITPQNPYDLMQLDVLDSRLPPGSPNGLGT